jgi:hypothetical protein
MNPKEINTEELSVIEKRKIIRELIANSLVESIKASDTNMLNSNECDSIIQEAQNNYESGNESETQESETQESNKSIQEALTVLTQALANNESNASNQELDKFRDYMEDRLEKTVDAMASSMNHLGSELDAIKDALKTPEVKKNIKVIQAKASGNNPMLNAITKYYTPSQEANTNVMLLSPPSFGKSHSVRILGDSYDSFLEHNCSSDIDEITTLIGNIIPDSSGSGFVNVDGVLTQAMREASEGKSVLLFLDEILRWNENTQAFLLTFLNGVEKTVNGVREKFYRLTTRKNNNGSLEVIESPSKNLHIISGANLTQEIPIQAFWSRFRKLRFDFNLGFCMETAKAILSGYNIKDYSDSDRELNMGNFISGFAKLMEETRKLAIEGSIQFPIDFRNLKSCFDDCSNWNPDSGDSLKESRDELKTVINDVYKTTFEKSN